MPKRFARSNTAQRVAEILGTRDGRAHLAEYGWEQGMPIVIATPNESLNDVMGLVSMHGRTVMVALTDAEADDVRFLHVSVPNAALRTVDVAADDEDIDSLLARADEGGMAEFRVKYWSHTAVAHPVPVHRPDKDSLADPLARRLMA